MTVLVPKRKWLDAFSSEGNDADPAVVNNITQVIQDNAATASLSEIMPRLHVTSRLRIPGGADKFDQEATVTGTFYPSLDGYVGMDADGTWAQIIAGAGDAAATTYDNNTLYGQTHSTTTDIWNLLTRLIFLFDTSSIPTGATILSAILYLFGDAIANNLTELPEMGVYAVSPASTSSLTASDYGTFGSTLLSNSIAHANWSTSGYNSYGLTPTGLTNITKGGITKLGWRLLKDVSGVTPSWEAGAKDYGVRCWSRLKGGDYRPKLVVVYSIPSEHTIWIESSNEHIIDTTNVERTLINTDDVDDTPVDAATTAPVSSNWAYDHVAAADPHTGYMLESILTAQGNVIYASAASTPAVLAPGTAGQLLRTAGASANPTWTTAVYPNTTVVSELLYSSATNTITGITTANSNILVTGGTGIPAWATDIPTAVTIGTAYIYRVGGTDVAVADGGTGLSSYTANNLLYASGTTTIAGLATANSGVLITSGAGVPSIATDIPTAVTIGTAYIYRAGGTDIPPADGGTGVSNGTLNTITFTGNYTLGITLSAATSVTLPTTGTLANTADITTHAALTTGVHGVGASTIASAADITTHAALQTGVHGISITAGKTLTVSNSLTLTATDGSTLAIGTGGTLGTGAYATIANYAPLASPTFTGTVTIPTPFTLGAVSVTATGTELNYVVGVTSAIQTQMNLKSPLASPTFTGTVTIPTPFTLGLVSVTATGTELNYSVGVTSAIQTQLNLKSPLASPTFTGTVTVPTPFTLGAISVTSTGTQLNYLNAATGTTGTTTTNIVFSASPTFTGTVALPIVTTTGSITLPNNTGINLENTSSAGKEFVKMGTDNQFLVSGGIGNLNFFGFAGATFRGISQEATGGVTLRNSPTFGLTAAYWTGAASVYWAANFLHTMDATTPKGTLGLTLNAVAAQSWENNNGTISVYLPSLTGNGFVKTSGGTGVLSVDTTSVPPIVARKAADETVSNSTTLQDDDALLFAVGANEVWAVTLVIQVTTTAVADLKTDFTLPVGGSLPYKMTITSFGTANYNAGTPILWNFASDVTGVLISFYGIYTGGANAGNVQLQWSQRIAEVSNTQILANSHIIAHKLA